MSYSLLIVQEPGTSILEVVRAARHHDDLEYRSADASRIFQEPARLIGTDAVVFVARACADLFVKFLAWLGAHPARPPVLGVLPEMPDREAMSAIARDADDFILWRPGGTEELLARVRRILPRNESRSAARQLTEVAALAKLVGADSTFVSMLSRIPLLARTSNTVLIAGETGSGKELCARALHSLSGRRDHPFIPVDCGALPELLVENELFGHVRGAFTDAHRDQEGLLAMAQGGTLLLDEVDSLTLSAQAKLLRLLEERVYKPLGAKQFTTADIKVITATNADLEELVRQKRFRADLYYRISALQLTVPPLRERRGDIALLARHFVARLAAEAGTRKTLAPSAVDALSRAPWPGNVRQLFNVIQSAVLLHEGPLVLPAHLGLPSTAAAGGCEGASGETSGHKSFIRAKAAALATFERSYLEDLLKSHHGNVTHSARAAGKDRRAFGRLLKKYNIDRLAF